MKQCGTTNATDDNIIRRILDNEGNRHTEYVIRSGLAREQLLHERASMLHLNVYSHLVPGVLYCTGTSVFVHQHLAKA